MTRQAEPIGTITFKYKAAQRRFEDRVLWDRLKTESPVYDGDLIRTAELSEARVAFAVGSTVDLAENSLIQLHEDGRGARIDIAEGGVNASAGDSALALVSGDRRITLDAGAVVKAGMDGGDFTLRVMEGTASFAGPGETRSVAAGETLALGDDGPLLVREAAALSPLPQTRFLNPQPGTYPVLFRWNRAHLPPEAPTRLEIAEDRGFSRIAFREELVADAATVELQPGSYFWRVSPAGEGAGPSPNILPFKILYAPAPVLITPVEGYRYQFRAKKPSVRFQWTEIAEAGSYVLEVADNPGMANPALTQEVRGTSFFYQGLGPGTWRWRVRPVFPASYQGAAGEAAPSSFSIVQSGDLRAPELQLPQDQGTVTVGANGEDIYFSWRAEAEARSYQIRIAANRNLSNPVIDELARDNFYIYRTGQNALAPGQYYWAVFQTDREGNDSALSLVRSFAALEGGPIQTLVFPPDGYVVESSKLPDTRFTWKTNLPFQTRFQIAGSPGFSSLLIDEAVSGGSFQGRVLGEGTWYWRIKARGPDDTVFETPPRSFTTTSPLAAPQLLEPSSTGWVFLKEGQPLVFSWTASAGADYYQFKVYHEGDRNNPVYENDLAEGTRQSLSMDSYPAGKYRWTVRGFARESSRTVQRTGLLSEGVFSARRLHPVILDYPGDGADFEGFPAYREPGTVRWSSADPVGASRFILSARSDFAGQPVAVIDNPRPSITLPRLPAGDYYWTIRAETPDGFDISAAAPRRFRVLPIPPLPRPANRLPRDGTVIGGAELKADRRILFSWDAVAGATGYLFALENAATGAALLRRGPLAETTLTLDDLTLLDVGTFVWRVEAVAAEPAGDGGNSGTILQRGELGENRFTIDFNLPAAPEPQEPGILYGREG
jgi:hypothetical protein